MKKQTTVVDAIRTCNRCTELVTHRTQPVIGEGPVPCDIVLLGEAPGQKEDETGVPFCGTTGMILEVVARRAGLQRKADYHILNILKCRPPENANPTEAQVKNCQPFLLAQLAAIKPKVVVALGKYAQAFILQKPTSQIRVVRNMGTVLQLDDYYAILSCHPRFTSRGPEITDALRAHLAQAADIRKGIKPSCIALSAF